MGCPSQLGFVFGKVTGKATWKWFKPFDTERDRKQTEAKKKQAPKQNYGSYIR